MSIKYGSSIKIWKQLHENFMKVKSISFANIIKEINLKPIKPQWETAIWSYSLWTGSDD